MTPKQNGLLEIRSKTIKGKNWDIIGAIQFIAIHLSLVNVGQGHLIYLVIEWNIVYIAL